MYNKQLTLQKLLLSEKLFTRESRKNVPGAHYIIHYITLSSIIPSSFPNLTFIHQLPGAKMK